MLSSLNVRVLLRFPWALCNAALGNKVTAVRGWSAAGQFEHWTSSTIQKEKGQYKWTWFMISWLIPFDTYLVEGDFLPHPSRIQWIAALRHCHGGVDNWWFRLRENMSCSLRNALNRFLSSTRQWTPIAARPLTLDVGTRNSRRWVILREAILTYMA